MNCCSFLPELGDVYVFGLTPPTGNVQYNGTFYPDIESCSAFEGIYLNYEDKGATLHVPVGCREAWDVFPWNVWFRTITDDAVDGIESLTPDPSPMRGESWYDLSGRKLGSKPAKAGLYIHNGKKVVIK